MLSKNNFNQDNKNNENRSKNSASRHLAYICLYIYNILIQLLLQLFKVELIFFYFRLEGSTSDS